VSRPSINRFDLLILLKTQRDHRHARVTISPDEAFEGWLSWNRPTSDSYADMNNPGLAVEAAQDQPFSILVATAPETEYVFAPESWCGVDPATGISASVGIVCRDRAGRAGVTTALHAVGTATRVKVNGHDGIVVARDTLSDSCFIEVDPLPIIG